MTATGRKRTLKIEARRANDSRGVLVTPALSRGLPVSFSRSPMKSRIPDQVRDDSLGGAALVAAVTRVNRVTLVSRHCERSEAIQSCWLDCFVANAPRNDGLSGRAPSTA